MDDLISRQTATKAPEEGSEMMTRKEAIARIKDHMSVHKMHEERAVKITEALNMAISALEQPIRNAPTADHEEFEWCTDCKEYDQEAHCCHRYTKVIRQAVSELNCDNCWHKTEKES